MPQPVRRGLHCHAAQHSGRITPAEIGGFNLHAGGVSGFFTGFFQRRCNRSYGKAIDRGDFARQPIVAKAVGAVRRDFRIEHRACPRLFHRIDRHTDKRKSRPEFWRGRRHINKFLQPVVENFHRGVVEEILRELAQEAHVVLIEERQLADSVLHHGEPVDAHTKGEP